MNSANFEDRVGGAGVARWRTWLTGEGEKVRFYVTFNRTSRRWMSDVEWDGIRNCRSSISKGIWSKILNTGFLTCRHSTFHVMH